MNAAWILPLIVLGPVQHPAVVTAQVRAEVRAAMTVSHASKRADPEAVTPEVLALYRRVSQSGALSAPEKKRLLRLLGTRLHDLEGRLTAKDSRPKKQSRSQVLAQRLPPVSGTNAGPVRTRAQELIDLIRETVDPETWDVRGGEGSISYFHPVLGLVVRQTAEVHETVADTLRNAR